MGREVFLIIVFLLISIPFASSFGYDNPTLPRVEREAPVVVAFDNNTVNVNRSEWWDSKRTHNSTQMDISDTELNIKESWLITFGNNLWCALTGCTMSGDLNMDSNEIHNLAGLNLTQDINLIDKNWLVPTPILNNHTANKEYVDDATSSTAFDFFFNNESSDISGSFNMTESDLERPESELDSASLGAGTHGIFNWTTIPGQPEFNELRQGVYDVHIHLAKSGTKPVTVTPKLYNVSSDGSISNLLVTFETTPLLTIAGQEYDLHGTLASPVMINNGDRLTLELEATVGATGNNVVVTIELEGTTDSHLTVETSSNAFEKIFIRRDGTNTLTGNWDVGDFNITNINRLGIGTDSPTHELNVVGNQNLTGNLTLGQKITFKFGEMIDNIVDGWLRITGNLNVTGSINVTGNISATGTVQGVTQVEFDVLTNDSMADILHRHSELSANDSSPDRAVRVNEDGFVGFGVDPTERFEINGRVLIKGSIPTTPLKMTIHNTAITDGADVALVFMTEGSREFVMGLDRMTGLFTFSQGSTFGTNDRLFIGASGGNGRVGVGAPAIYPFSVTGNISGISIWSDGNVSASGYITRTSIFDNSKNVWDYIKDSDYYLKDGEIEHTKFYGYAGEFDTIDFSIPMIEQYIEEECDEVIVPYSQTSEVCEIFGNEIICNNVIETINNYKQINCEKVIREKTTYPHTKKVGGVLMDSEIELLRQGIWELKQENEMMKEDLCSLGITRWCP